LLADAWVAATRGYLTRAGDLARRAAGFCRDHRQYAREVLCLQTAVQFGANDSAVRSRLNELAGLVDGPRASLAARYAHAVDADDAAALTVISTEWQAIGDPLAAADAAAQASTAYAAQGRRGAARTAAERATSIATAQHATSPATRTAAFPLPLTPREREIAVMVADGLSNQQIAEELAASVRTVEGHVYRAFHKLGVADRNELAAVIQASRNPSGRQPEGQTKL
jgi:DNA-binding CsgD family transcriptional regulator